MPIRPEHRFFYPIDWAQLSAVIRFGRPQHQRRRWRALFRRKAIGDLFGGPYA